MKEVASFSSAQGVFTYARWEAEISWDNFKIHHVPVFFPLDTRLLKHLVFPQRQEHHFVHQTWDCDNEGYHGGHL